jgi:hypothetical protein
MSHLNKKQSSAAAHGFLLFASHLYSLQYFADISLLTVGRLCALDGFPLTLLLPNFAFNCKFKPFYFFDLFRNARTVPI